MFRPAAVKASQATFAPELPYRTPKVLPFFYSVIASLLLAIVWGAFSLSFNDRRTLPGSVLSSSPAIEIYAARSGYITDFEVQSEARVLQGADLFVIVDQSLYTAASRYESELSYFEQQRTHSKARWTHQQNDASQQFVALDGDIEFLLSRADTLSTRREVAVRNYQLAMARYRRSELLVAQGALSRTQLEDTRVNVGMQLERLVTTINDLGEVAHQIRAREQQKESLNATLQRAQLAYQSELSDLQHKETELNERHFFIHASPSKGIVDQLLVRPGDWVERGQLLAVIRSDSKYRWVRAWTDIDLARRLNMNSDVILKYRRFEDEQVGLQTGRIRQLGETPVVQGSAHLVSVDVELRDWLDGAERQVNDGDTAEVIVTIAQFTLWERFCNRLAGWRAHW